MIFNSTHTFAHRVIALAVNNRQLPYLSPTDYRATGKLIFKDRVSSHNCIYLDRYLCSRTCFNFQLLEQGPCL